MTFFYDFKRSFLRLSVIIFIIIFAVLGVATAYEAYVNLGQAGGQLNVVGVTLNNGQVIGYVFNNQGEPISNAEIYVNSTVYKTNSSGYFEFHYRPTVVDVVYNGQKRQFVPNVIFLNTSEYVSSEYMPSIGGNSQFLFVLTNKGDGEGTLILVDPSPHNQQVYINFSSSRFGEKFSSSNSGISSSSQYFKYIGNITTYFNFYTIQIPSAEATFALKILSPNNIEGVTTYYPHGYATIRLIGGITSSLDGFAFIFPVIMLYLAYVLFSKPRDSGALKFILARPVTRRELYINRYLGGVLTAVLSSLLLSFISYITLSILVLFSGGFLLLLLPISVPLELFVSIAAALIAFFSLVYMLPSFIKSAGTVLGISIFLFLFFEIGIPIIAGVIGLTTGNISNIFQITYKLYYFSPIGAESFGIYYIEHAYGIVSSISSVILPLVIVSSLIWIIVPFIIGLKRFDKINI
jgi:ABC-2 type transport system permease protein